MILVQKVCFIVQLNMDGYLTGFFSGFEPVFSDDEIDDDDDDNNDNQDDSNNHTPIRNALEASTLPITGSPQIFF